MFDQMHHIAIIARDYQEAWFYTESCYAKRVARRNNRDKICKKRRSLRNG